MATRTARERWVEAGLDALGRGGVESVRVEVLAARLGVTKGGFYGYFAGRPQLLAEMLDEWERRFTADVLARADAEGGDPAEQLRRAGELSAGEEFHRVDLAVRTWARFDTTVAERLRRVDTLRMDFLRTRFRAIVADPDEAEARSTLLFALAVGRSLMAPDHAGRTHTEAVQQAARFLLRPAGDA